ncbi:YciI family protein [Saccharothrix longispora]|uniref:YciI family protein n=1 Tax=Saccharothrix longispora TaxID=33920 RepID=UPI0028FDB0CF|nr:YciI family protein [Saccharothrix longispora]MDU0289814.1 YciI family protein [Saccharothrix longispora]
MRFLMMHRLAESAPEVRNPDPEFVERVGAFVRDWTDRGVLISAEGVHPSERGARVRKVPDGTITAVDGPFTEAKEVVGGFLLIDAEDRAAAVECARRYADLFGQVEVEVRQVVEFEDLAPAP